MPRPRSAEEAQRYARAKGNERNATPRQHGTQAHKRQYTRSVYSAITNSPAIDISPLSYDLEKLESLFNQLRVALSGSTLSPLKYDNAGSLRIEHRVQEKVHRIVTLSFQRDVTTSRAVVLVRMYYRQQCV